MNPVIDTLFCDEIRQEMSGKLFVIGLYVDDIRVVDPPMTIPLTAWLRFLGLPKGEHKNTLRIKLNDQEIFSANGVVSSDGITTPNAFAFNVPVKVEGPGMLSIEVQFGDGELIPGGSLSILISGKQEQLNR